MLRKLLNSEHIYDYLSRFKWWSILAMALQPMPLVQVGEPYTVLYDYWSFDIVVLCGINMAQYGTNIETNIVSSVVSI